MFRECWLLTQKVLPCEIWLTQENRPNGFVYERPLTVAPWPNWAAKTQTTEPVTWQQTEYIDMNLYDKNICLYVIGIKQNYILF